jgi:hypothetical protein
MYSERDSETPPSKTLAHSISASRLTRAKMESNPLMKLSRYSPGIFPPGEKEKEEGVEGGEGRLEEEEHCSIRGGVEPPDPIPVVGPPTPSPTEAASGVGAVGL